MYSIRIPSLTFVGVPVPTLWVIVGHGVKRPGDIHRRHFDLVVGFFHASFQLATPFHSRLIGSSMGQTDGRTDAQTTTINA